MCQSTGQPLKVQILPGNTVSQGRGKDPGLYTGADLGENNRFAYPVVAL